MKNYACLICGHTWLEPRESRKKSGWGCPNGCLGIAKEVIRNPEALFEEFLGDSLNDKTNSERQETIDYLMSVLKRKKDASA